MGQIPIAVTTLGRLGKTDELAALANDAQLDEKVRQMAAEELVALGEGAKALAVFSLLAGSDDLDETVRLQAAATLGDLGNTEQAAAVLVSLANSTTNLVNRYVAARALIELGRADAGKTLLLQMVRDKTTLWTSALGLLLREGFIGEVATLANEKRSDIEVCYQIAYECLLAESHPEATQSLHSLALHALENKKVLKVLDKPSKSMEWQISIAELLGHLGATDKARPVLTRIALDPHQNGKTRLEVAKILGDLQLVDDAVSALNLLVQEQSHETAALRLEAARKIAGLGQLDEAARVLTALAHEQQSQFTERIKAVEALSGVGRQEQALAVLRELTVSNADNEVERECVALAFARLGCGDEVCQIVEKSNLAVSSRFQLAEALQTAGKPKWAAELYYAVAQDTGADCRYRCEAALKLSECGDNDEAAEILDRIVRDNDHPDEDNACVAALKSLNRAEELRTLMKEYTARLRKDEWMDAWKYAWIPVAAATALGELGHAAEVTQYLMEITRDHALPFTSVKTSAIENLAQFAWLDDLDALASSKELSVDVRLAAAKALGNLGKTESLWQFANDESIGGERQTAISMLEELNQGGLLVETGARLACAD